MTILQTRVASLADLMTVATLFDAYRQFYAQPGDLGRATRFIQERLERQQSVILLAIGDEQQALGFCQMYPTFCSVEAVPIYTLSDLFVAPLARRTGAGRALLQAAEQQAVKNGMARLELTTARANHTAQSLHESMGWVKDEVFLAYQRRAAA